MEAALYVPSGTMANLIALMTHSNRGNHILLEAYSDILWSEEWSFAYVVSCTATSTTPTYRRSRRLFEVSQPNVDRGHRAPDMKGGGVLRVWHTTRYTAPTSGQRTPLSEASEIV
jgi:threonine aldolase